MRDGSLSADYTIYLDKAENGTVKDSKGNTLSISGAYTHSDELNELVFENLVPIRPYSCGGITLGNGDGNTDANRGYIDIDIDNLPVTFGKTDDNPNGEWSVIMYLRGVPKEIAETPMKLITAKDGDGNELSISIGRTRSVAFNAALEIAQRGTPKLFKNYIQLYGNDRLYPYAIVCKHENGVYNLYGCCADTTFGKFTAITGESYLESGIFNATELIIGTNATGLRTWRHHVISNIHFYNRALTRREIRSIVHGYDVDDTI